MHTGKPVGVEADGEFIGYTPVEIELLPGEIEFLLPPLNRQPTD